MRPYIALSTFGFYTNGHLDVHLNHLTIDDEKPDDVVRISRITILLATFNLPLLFLVRFGTGQNYH